MKNLDKSSIFNFNFNTKNHQKKTSQTALKLYPSFHHIAKCNHSHKTQEEWRKTVNYFVYISVKNPQSLAIIYKREKSRRQFHATHTRLLNALSQRFTRKRIAFLVSMPIKLLKLSLVTKRVADCLFKWETLWKSGCWLCWDFISVIYWLLYVNFHQDWRVMIGPRYGTFSINYVTQKKVFLW